MRILLVGEFSGLHSYLRDGLIALGHTATLMARGDGFKKFQPDIPLDAGIEGKLGGFASRILLPFELARAEGGSYDVAQLVNAFTLCGTGMPHNLSLKLLRKVAPRFFLLAAGDDAMFWKHGRKNLKQGLFNDYLKYDLKARRSPLESEWSYRWNEKVAKTSAGVIPVNYEYEVSYKDHPKKMKTIPLPVNLEKITYRENNVGRRLVVFHGLNRYGFKGTRLVEKAFAYLSQRYPNDLELVIDGRMPHTEYLELMSRTNIVVDQMYAHSLGINGLQALAQGKVVLGGVEPQALKSLGVENSPAIGLQPTVRSIVENIEKIMESRNEIGSLGLKGRKFVENVHDCVKVADLYVRTWDSSQCA